MKKKWIAGSVVLALTVAATLVAVPALADPLGVLTAPGLEVQGVTDTAVVLTVTAGVNHGTPNGFTVQWMAVPAGWKGVWPGSGYDQAIFCGQAVTDSPFVLPPDEEVDVVIGLEDERPEVVYVPETASEPLRPGTQYVFRAFANGLGGSYQQGPYSGRVYATTTGETPPSAPPHGEDGDGGKPDWQPVWEREHTRRGKGFWKNHGDWSADDEVDYEDFFGIGLSWAEVLNTPPAGGDAYFMLAHKYITAKLNVLAGHVPPDEVAAAVLAAEDYFEDAGPGVKTNTPEGKANLELAAILASWGGLEDGPERGLHYLDTGESCEGLGLGNAARGNPGGPPPGKGPATAKIKGNGKAKGRGK